MSKSTHIKGKQEQRLTEDEIVLGQLARANLLLHRVAADVDVDVQLIAP